MDEKFFVLRPGPNYEDLNGYNTVEIAHDDGAVILAYGYVHLVILLTSCLQC